MNGAKTIGGALLGMVPRGKPVSAVTGSTLLAEAQASLNGTMPAETQADDGSSGAPARSFIDKLRGERSRAAKALEEIDDPVEFKARRVKLRDIDERIAAYEAGANAQK